MEGVTSRGRGWERVKNLVMVSGAGCEVTAVGCSMTPAGRSRLRHRMFAVTWRVEFEPTSFIKKKHFDHKQTITAVVTLSADYTHACDFLSRVETWANHSVATVTRILI